MKRRVKEKSGSELQWSKGEHSVSLCATERDSPVRRWGWSTESSRSLKDVKMLFFFFQFLHVSACVCVHACMQVHACLLFQTAF